MALVHRAKVPQRVLPLLTSRSETKMNCPKCGKDEAHFIPPGFGSPGVYTCQAPRRKLVPEENGMVLLETNYIDDSIIEEIALKFKSGNNVPVTRAMIKLEEWNRLLAFIELLEAYNYSEEDDL